MDAQPQTTRSLRRPGPPSISVRSAFLTDVGRVRTRNEDCALITSFGVRTKEASRSRALGMRGLLACVCDGLGGAAAGDVASHMAVESIERALSQLPMTATSSDAASALSNAIREAGAAIREEGMRSPSRRGMGTTCTAAFVRDDRLWVGHVGDSRAYLLRNGVLAQITRDHNVLQELLERGAIDPEHRARAPQGNVLLQALGPSRRLDVELTSLTLRRGDRLLLCSDGLTGFVSDGQIRDVLMQEDDLEKACARLVTLANQAGGRDNVTVALCVFGGTGLTRVGSDGDDPEVRAPLRRALMAVAACMIAGALTWAAIRQTRVALAAPPIEHVQFEPGRKLAAARR